MSHRIEWTLEPEAVTSTFTCDEPAGSSCRMYCAGGCEAEPCDHDDAMQESSDSCNILDWLADDDAERMYSGPPTFIRNAVITPVWDGNGYSWHYADGAAR